MENLEIIRAKIKDDAVVLIDRIMRASLDNIVIVLPKNSIIAANLSSVKNLKEEAESINKKLFFVTTNEKIKSKAAELGAAAGDTIEASLRRDEVRAATDNPEAFEISHSKPKTVHSTPLKSVTRMVDIVAPNFGNQPNDDIPEVTE